jgi:hypothetical protein
VWLAATALSGRAPQSLHGGELAVHALEIAAAPLALQELLTEYCRELGQVLDFVTRFTREGLLDTLVFQHSAMCTLRVTPLSFCMLQLVHEEMMPWPRLVAAVAGTTSAAALVLDVSI